MRRDQQSLLMLSHHQPRPKVNLKIATFEEPGERIRWSGLQNAWKTTLIPSKFRVFVIVMKVTMILWGWGIRAPQGSGGGILDRSSRGCSRKHAASRKLVDSQLRDRND
ncbi:hypothetical protein ASPBRDRAFT_194681 [Aspergillus brasiliensis CBS 101740]|uniref:Uncharacterized protein n=1 Tax=Aspergillus brasiliensis (strain CBS 101740 / IMI 381727 / IBT 21946) TaxID=767769 RepID=A0A1L9UQ45_ASPBC|nr:hypothetical protein ASPBRDRAFT_194681 [Aspergillus brasiliensis CBS 101740]